MEPVVGNALQQSLTADVKARCISAAKSIAREYASLGPPFGFQLLLERFNISEVRERPLDRDAKLVFQDGHLAIEINPLFPLNRRRLSIAHELGHILINEQSGRGPLYAGHDDPSSEALCNRLAGELLAPDSAVRAYFGDQATLASWQDSVRCSTLMSGAARFGISIDAMACRVFNNLEMVPSKVALIWRYSRNSTDPRSDADLRLASAWHCIPKLGFIPRNKTASPSSVITRAFREAGVFTAEEDLRLGALTGTVSVEALGAGKHFREGVASRAVLAIVSL